MENKLIKITTLFFLTIYLGFIMAVSLLTTTVFAQDSDSIGEYWSTEDSGADEKVVSRPAEDKSSEEIIKIEDKSSLSNEAAQEDKRFNIFFKTDKGLYKLGWFILFSVVSYLLFWRIFVSLLKKDKSPSKTFFYCFLCFLISLYWIAFFCFSEYALEQKYDTGLSYFSQLNWTILGGVLLAWVVFSMVLTQFFRGRS